MTKPEATEILQQLASESKDNFYSPTLEELIELLENNYDIQSQFGSWAPSSGGMFSGIKNKILSVISTVVVTVARPAFRKQEKFNQLTLQALKLIQQQNEARRSHPN